MVRVGEAAIGAITILIITPGTMRRPTAITPTAVLPIRTGRAAEVPMQRVTAGADVLRDALLPCLPLLRLLRDRPRRWAAVAAQGADVLLKTCTEAATVVRRRP